jgi:hypothetical protein
MYSTFASLLSNHYSEVDNHFHAILILEGTNSYLHDFTKHLGYSTFVSLLLNHRNSKVDNKFPDSLILGGNDSTLPDLYEAPQVLHFRKLIDIVKQTTISMLV